MNPPTDLETRLRASLRDNARHAPPDGPLAERILAELDAPVLRPHRSWRTWTFPLLAAAAIAAVALTLAGVGAARHTAAPAGTGHASQTLSPSQTPSPSTTPTVTTPPPPAPRTTLPLLDMGGITGFRAIDTTYIGTDKIWALGRAACSQGSCLTLMRTTDSGSTWHAVPVPAVAATSIRFANPQTGFIFGRDVLESTTDGGAHWSPESGGAEALETLDGTVIKVSRDSVACSSLCLYNVSYAHLGSSGWTQSTVPFIRGYSVQLMRAHGVSYLLVRTSNPASAQQQGQLYQSTDGGASWRRSSACTNLIGGSVASDGTLDLLCGADILVDAHTPSAHRVPQPTGISATIAAVDKHTLIVVADRLFRLTGGVQLTTALDQAPVGDLGPPGFQNGQVGRWINENGHTIWTTTDGGATWSGAAFSR